MVRALSEPRGNTKSYPLELQCWVQTLGMDCENFRSWIWLSESKQALEMCNGRSNAIKLLWVAAVLSSTVTIWKSRNALIF